MSELAIGLLIVVLVILIAFYVKSVRDLKALRQRFAPVISIEDETKRLTDQADNISSDITAMKADYKKKYGVLKELEKQIAIYDETVAFAEFGVYEPHFDFGDSETYKNKIKAVKGHQKELVKNKTAAVCLTEWQVSGSAAKGRAMTNRQIRLTLRAFNGECTSSIANARWNNVKAMQRRIENSYKQINNANASQQVQITDEFLQLKLRELHLTHEYRQQQQIEREERAELARAKREERRLIKEAKAAEREEKKYQKLLDRARKSANVDKDRIAQLMADLAEAKETGRRARSLAQVTATGYVYVVSNVGSFGEDVVKIGLTRRLNPYDRVRDLGDASVPFQFDTHAMIYSNKAPALETALHKEFDNRRVNAVNRRKEFFHASLAEVKEAINRFAPDAEFIDDREAQEWHETLALRKQVFDDKSLPSEKFPTSI